MWEFSIKFDRNFASIYDYIFSKLENIIKNVGGVITSEKSNNCTYVTLACENYDKNRVKFYISDCITDAICTSYKKIYIEKRLNIVKSDELIMIALKNALVSFDRETDKFIVNKNIVLEKTLNLDSFFNFKLKCLREKWGELIRIANENCGLFVSDDTYIELLRFLIDNLDIVNSTVNIIIKKNSCLIYDEFFEKIEPAYDKETKLENLVISNLINLSPKKIIMYCDDSNSKLCELIKQIFYKRVTLMPYNALKNLNKYEKTLDNSI